MVSTFKFNKVYYLFPTKLISYVLIGVFGSKSDDEIIITNPSALNEEEHHFDHMEVYTDNQSCNDSFLITNDNGKQPHNIIRVSLYILYLIIFLGTIKDIEQKSQSRKFTFTPNHPAFTKNIGQSIEHKDFKISKILKTKTISKLKIEMKRERETHKEP